MHRGFGMSVIVLQQNAPRESVNNWFYFSDRLEEKKRQVKPVVKDPKLQELHEKLEARKAGR